ncbi:MAG: DUF3102 domain-containing protein [Chloroflexota bacterium]|nr:DUF3102 domain-containing protein [Chloroflexota bacterium]
MSAIVPQTTPFDYQSLPPEDARTLRSSVPQIRAGLKQTAQNVVVIGQQLLAAKARLPHGQWLPWLRAEFALSERSAQSFMRVAERFGDKSAAIADLAPAVIALLAMPITPDTVVAGVLAGEIPPTAAAIRAARRAAIPQPRRPGELPAEGIGEKARRVFAANRGQRRIAGYVERLLVALDDLYRFDWDAVEELADACGATWTADVLPERRERLGVAASDLLALAEMLGYGPEGVR